MVKGSVQMLAAYWLCAPAK